MHAGAAYSLQIVLIPDATVVVKLLLCLHAFSFA